MRALTGWGMGSRRGAPARLGRGVVAAVAVACVLATGHARGAGPPDRYSVGADTALDRETRLTWQRTPAPVRYSWADAKGYCNALTLGGLGDWRLPSVRELQSLVSPGTLPAIYMTAFPGTMTGLFWTSTPVANDASLAWAIDADPGYSTFGAKTGMNQVRCVRGP